MSRHPNVLKSQDRLTCTERSATYPSRYTANKPQILQGPAAELQFRMKQMALWQFILYLLE